MDPKGPRLRENIDDRTIERHAGGQGFLGPCQGGCTLPHQLDMPRIGQEGTLAVHQAVSQDFLEQALFYRIHTGSCIG